MFASAGILITFAAFDVKAYVEDGRLAQILLLFVFYAWGMLPYMYLWSLVFRYAVTGFVRLALFNIVTGRSDTLCGSL